MIEITHSNQEENFHRKRNTKSARNATQDMESRLTQKQLSGMCRRLLDAMWDVIAASLMLGMNFVVFGL